MKKYEIQKSMNGFAMNLYHTLNGKISGGENIFFGPASVYAALAMVYSGTRETTAEEVKTVLCLPKASENFHEIFSKVWGGIIKANNRTNDCTLDVANRLWVKTNQQIEQDFLKGLKENYQADAVNLDFEGNVESARAEINKWVEGKTNQKIKDMIQPGYLKKTTRFLITNAMYFYGEWRCAFEEKDTKSMPFHTPNGIINVDMMYQKENYGFHQSKEYDCKVLLQCYRKSTLQLLIILPNKVDGITALEQRLHAEHFEGEHMWDWTMLRHKDVHFYLPKFQIFEKTDLVESLQSMGMHRLFLDADLSGISKTKDLSVSGVSHAAYINVNEKGTEIAAATDCTIQRAGISIPAEFKVDHPFLLMVMDKDTEVILFWGRVCKPFCG